MSRKHPLKDQADWNFIQSTVGIHAPIQVIPKDDSESVGRKVNILASGSCREGLVHGVRSRLQGIMGTVSREGLSSWQRKIILKGTAELELDALRQPGQSYVWVHKNHIISHRQKLHPKAGQLMPRPPWYCGHWSVRYPKFARLGTAKWQDKWARDFIDICNAIIGPVTVLMNPDRYEGNWWKTSKEEASETQGQLRWYGIDNTILAHPALVSLYSGLARQCALLTRVNIKAQILENIDKKELHQCLTDSDPELALRLARRMRPWIEVIVPRGGYVSNLAVPKGSFAKIPNLHKAIYAHGFDKTFKHSFEKRWGLAAGPSYQGIHSYMGNRGTNKNGLYVRALAKKAK